MKSLRVISLINLIFIEYYYMPSIVLGTLPCVVSSLHGRSLSLALWAILQKKKLKLREAKSHVKEHTASAAGIIMQLLSLQT